MGEKMSHFNNISNKYHEQAENINAKVYEGTSLILNQFINDRVILDIGSGGFFPYSVEIPQKILAVDLSPKMLDKIKHSNIIPIVDNALELNHIEGQSFDTAIFNYSIHHFVGRSSAECINNFKTALLKVKGLIRQKGEILISEATLLGLFFALEKVIYPMLSMVCRIQNKECPFFYSTKKLKEIVLDVFPNAQIDVHSIFIDGKIDPLSGTFPGKISLPVRFSPTRFKVFRIKHLEK